ncbi:DMT family transporter [Xanthobacter sp. TB0139]|uniref:DMT family transporter n=1 Tax=Xanthobacter sp. TB0139 TaxID=3459178 RepID=UPI00403983EC
MSVVSAQDAPFGARESLLYATNVLIFGSGWLPMKLQLGVVSPEVSALWRFMAVTVVMFIVLVVMRGRFFFRWKDHLLFAGLGATLFSLNFLSFYYAGYYLPSGLMSVVFSLAAIIIPVLSAIFLNMPVHPKLVAGAVAGASGIALIFGPTIMDAEGMRDAGMGLLLALAGTMCFSLGSLFSGIAGRRALPLASMTAWGFFYGFVILAVIVAIRGLPLIVEWTPRYIGTLTYLVLVQTLLGFAVYLMLIRRIGASRAGYGTVMFPLVALAISTWFEGYQWTLVSGLGVSLVLSGALLVLMPRRSHV